MRRAPQIASGLWLFLFIFAPAAPAQFRFDSWTTDNGLPQASINSILQTRDGFLWFTTYGGLVRYDGLRFQVFNTGNTKGLRTGRLSNLFEDREGTLWISTEGQGLTRYRNGTFTTYTTENGLPDNQVQRLEGDANGNLLFQARDTLWQLKGDSFAPYSPAAGEPVKGVTQRMPGGAVWYIDGSHLRKFDHGRVTVDFASGFQILRTFEDSQGRVWISADKSENLFMLKDGKLISYGVRDGYSSHRNSTVLEDRQGRLWFGNFYGVSLFRDGKFTNFTSESGLLRGGAGQIYQDREGTVWLGAAGGLTRVTEQAITTYSVSDGLAAENAYPICEDRQGRIWIGSWSGLTVYDDGSFQVISELEKDLVSALLEDREGYLWVGTWGSIFRRAPDGKFTVWPQHELIGPRVRVIYQDHAGNIWFGSANGLFKGVKKLIASEKFLATMPADGKGTDLEIISFTAKDGLSGKEVFAIHEDRQGQLWIGSDAGLTKYKDGVLTRVTEKEGMAGGIVRAIYEDRDGTLWIGMYDTGLYRFAQGQFTHYTTKDGLFDDGAFQIIEDARANFWISCNLGIYRIIKSELNDFAAGRLQQITSIPYNKRDGMLNSECNGGMQPAGIKARDGRIWFPTQQGVAVINPAAMPFNTQPPPVVIESLIVDTQPVESLSPVRLTPGQEYLEIHYSGLSFINPELVRFKYRLTVLDANWVDAGTRRIAYYSHLPPGKYRFTIIAANRDGIWNEKGASIDIVVLPPFWRTWWFLILAIVTLGAMAFAFSRQRIRLLHQTPATQEAFSQQLIQSQENERRRIAAELHDSLGQSLVLIKNWALLGLKAAAPQESTRDNLNEISTTASEAINEVREIAYNLGPYQLERLGLSRTIKEMVQKIASSSQIHFQVEIVQLDGVFAGQAETNIFRIVQEAINNIVKHSAATEAGVIIKADTTRVVLTIRDNGKGFVPGATGADGARRGGFGLLGLAERVRMLRGEWTIESEPGKGTVIEIKLPREV